MGPGYIVYNDTVACGYHFVTDVTTDSTSYTPYFPAMQQPQMWWRDDWEDDWEDVEGRDKRSSQAFDNFLNVIRYRYDLLMLWKYTRIKSKHIMILTNSYLRRWNK